MSIPLVLLQNSWCVNYLQNIIAGKMWEKVEDSALEMVSVSGWFLKGLLTDFIHEFLWFYGE